MAPAPIAVSLVPAAEAWQFALLSKSEFATLPELHPAIAGAAQRPASSAIRMLVTRAALRTVRPAGMVLCRRISDIRTPMADGDDSVASICRDGTLAKLCGGRI
jgi:hypothetical protein